MRLVVRGQKWRGVAASHVLAGSLLVAALGWAGEARADNCCQSGFTNGKGDAIDQCLGACCAQTAACKAETTCFAAWTCYIVHGCAGCNCNVPSPATLALAQCVAKCTPGSVGYPDSSFVGMGTGGSGGMSGCPTGGTSGKGGTSASGGTGGTGKGGTAGVGGVGATGAGANGTGATGAGANGTGATGAGANGTGASTGTGKGGSPTSGGGFGATGASTGMPPANPDAGTGPVAAVPDPQNVAFICTVVGPGQASIPRVPWWAVAAALAGSLLRRGGRRRR